MFVCPAAERHIIGTPQYVMRYPPPIKCGESQRERGKKKNNVIVAFVHGNLQLLGELLTPSRLTHVVFLSSPPPSCPLHW